jgi:hypothetical protein
MYPSALVSEPVKLVLGALGGSVEYLSTATTCGPAPTAYSIWVEVADIDTIRFGVAGIVTAPFAAVTVTGKAAEAGLEGTAAGFDAVHPPNTLATTTAATISRLTALLLSVEMVWFDDREVCRSTSPFRACLGRYRPDRRPGSSSREDPQLRDSAGFTPDFADRSVAPLP